MTYSDQSPEQKLFLMRWRSYTQGMSYENAMQELEQRALMLATDNANAMRAGQELYEANQQLMKCLEAERQLLLHYKTKCDRLQQLLAQQSKYYEQRRSPVLPKEEWRSSKYPELHREWRSID
jgi:hypothetical protein